MGLEEQGIDQWTRKILGKTRDRCESWVPSVALVQLHSSHWNLSSSESSGLGADDRGMWSILTVKISEDSALDEMVVERR